MNKAQILALIKEQLSNQTISKNDLLALAENTPISESSHTEKGSKNITNTFYGIGAIIAVVGVGILIGQHWTEIGFAGRILVSLGISLAAFVIAMILQKPQQRLISETLFTISAALAPLGAYVLLDQAGISMSAGVNIAVSLILTVIFSVALYVSKKNILILLVTGFATWVYFAIIINIFDINIYAGDILKWACMILGISYLVLAYGHRMNTKPSDALDIKEKRVIQNILYGLGTLAILGGAISIGGIFDLITIALIFGAFYGSVYLKSRAMLVFGALFLIGHIINLTSKYFLDSIGWPVALIVIGFLVIGIGYLTVYLNRKFISLK